jgi:hypothetical protein
VVNPMLSKQNFMLLICKLAARIAWLESWRCGFLLGLLGLLIMQSWCMLYLMGFDALSYA